MNAPMVPFTVLHILTVYAGLFFLACRSQSMYLHVVFSSKNWQSEMSKKELKILIGCQMVILLLKPIS